MKLSKKVTEWLKSQKNKIKENLSILGFFWGSFCTILSLVLLFSPSLILIFAGVISGDYGYYIIASGYAGFIVAPSFGVGLILFTVLLIITTTITLKIKKISYKER